MGRVDITFRALTPDQVEELNACYKHLYQRDLENQQSQVKRAAAELARDISNAGLARAGTHTQPDPQPSPPPAPQPLPWQDPTPPNPFAAAASTSAAPAAPSSAPTAPIVTPAPAPTPPAAPSNVLPGTPRDKEGIPYNEQLHAPLNGVGNGLMKTGVWKRKKSAPQAAYDAWRNQHLHAVASTAAASAPPTPAPDAGPAPSAPPMSFAEPAPATPGAPPMPPAHMFFAGATAPSDDLSHAPEVSEEVFTKTCFELNGTGKLTAEIAEKVMTHPQIAARDAVEVTRDPEKRRRAMVLLLRLKDGTWPLAA